MQERLLRMGYMTERQLHLLEAERVLGDFIVATKEYRRDTGGQEDPSIQRIHQLRTQVRQERLAIEADLRALQFQTYASLPDLTTVEMRLMAQAAQDSISRRLAKVLCQPSVFNPSGCRTGSFSSQQLPPLERCVPKTPPSGGVKSGGSAAASPVNSCSPPPTPKEAGSPGSPQAEADAAWQAFTQHVCAGVDFAQVEPLPLVLIFDADAPVPTPKEIKTTEAKSPPPPPPPANRYQPSVGDLLLALLLERASVTVHSEPRYSEELVMKWLEQAQQVRERLSTNLAGRRNSAI